MKPTSHNDLFERSCAARDAFWAGWGDVDDDVLAPVVNPAFQGLPRWPGLRQAYRTVRRGSLTLVATDGLSDPFDDDASRSNEQGLRLECFAVTKDPVPSVRDSWLLALVMQVAMNAADHGGFRSIIDKHGTVSMQLFDVPVPDEWVQPDGSVGVLLNVQDDGAASVPSRIELPLGDVLVVNVKLLTGLELAYIGNGGAAARAELARRFAASGEAQRSGLGRRSVV